MDPAHLQFLHTLPGSEGFTDDFKEQPEWDWMETPVGMVYIDTRRQERPGLGAGRRFHSAQHPPVPAQRRPDGAAQLDQPAAGDDLGGAARRHPHDADRLLPRAGGQGHAPRHRVRPGRQPLL